MVKGKAGRQLPSEARASTSSGIGSWGSPGARSQPRGNGAAEVLRSGLGRGE